MHGQHQQAILRQRGQPAFEEGELVLAQAADVTRLLARQQDHVVEDRDVGQRGLPRERVRPDRAMEAGERSGIAGRTRIDIVVAGRMQPGDPQRGGGCLHLGQQRRDIVDQVAQGDAERGAMGA